MATPGLHQEQKSPRYYSCEIITRIDLMLARIPELQRPIATDHVLTEMARRYAISQQPGDDTCK